MIARKGLFIVLLISLIAGYFYLRPYLHGHNSEPDLTDRLPMGDFLGKVQLLDLARETNSFLYYNKLPFRDFLTYEFILAQGKSYGLDIQKPAYFFSSESGEWGSLISVTDSSKIISGIVRLKQTIEIADTLIGGQKVVQVPNKNIYMTYGKNWLFVYHGKQMTKRMYHVMYTKKGQINPVWKDFLEHKIAQNTSLVIYSNWSKLKRYGIDRALFSPKCDSIHIGVNTYFMSNKPFDFKLKKEGLAIPNTIVNDKSITFHFDIEKIRKNPNSPLKLWLSDISKRISFPVEAFFNAWEGDITLQEGGKQKIKETIIETEFDEEFNQVEVKRQKEIDVPGYNLLLSMNKEQKNFVSTLFAKGIMRQDKKRFYILTSPPLKINQHPKYLLLYSSQFAPKISTNSDQKGYMKYNKTLYDFSLDSLNENELFFSFRFSGMSLLKRNKLL